MAWNSGQNCNGANIHPENQYLMQHGPQAVPTLSNQMIGIPLNSSGQGGMNVDRFYAGQSQERYLESLLKAKSNEDIDRLQQSILSLPSYPQSNQVAQTQGTVVSNNVPYRPLPSGGGTYSSQDYTSQNMQQMKRMNYTPKHYANVATQSQKPLQSQSQQNVHGKQHDMTVGSSRSCQAQIQTFPLTGGYGPSQTQGPHQAQNLANLPSYSTSRLSLKGSYPRAVMPKVPLTAKAQHDLQNGAKPLKLTIYTPSSFVASSNSNSDCTPSLQTLLMSNGQTGLADGSVFIERSSDGYPTSTSTASMPSQSLPIQTRGAPQAQSVQSSQQFPSQAQNYVPPAVQLSTAGICEPNRASQLVQYMRSLPQFSKEREDFSVLLHLYNKVKQNIIKMAMEGELKMQNGQMPTNVVPGGVNVNSEPELNAHPTLPTLTSNMQTMNVNSGTPSRQNVQQSACFQIRANGNQATTSSSKQLESLRQTYAHQGWNVNDQAAYSSSSQQASVNTPSYSNHSLGSNHSKVTQVLSVRSAVLPNNLTAETIPQNVNQEFIPNVNTRTERMSQTGVLQHDVSLSSPNLPRATPNYQNNGHFVPNMGQVATVSMDHSGFQQSIQKRPLPQPDNVTVSLHQCRKTPPYQVNANLVPSNDQLSSKGVENPVSQPNSHNLPSPVTTIPNTNILSNSLEAIDTCLSMWKMKTFNDSGSSQNSLTERNQTLAENNNQRDTSDSNDWSAEMSVMGHDSISISNVTSLKQEVGSSKVTEPQIAIVSPLVQAKTKNHTESQSVLTNELLIPAEEGSSFNNPNGPVNTFGGGVSNVPPGGFKRHLLNELKAVKTVLDSISSHQNTPMLDSDSGVHCSVQKQSICKPQNEQLLQVSNEESETNHEGSFQISGICSLVEGNTFYNSSVALMFNDLLLPPEAPSSLSKTDLNMAVDQQDRPEMAPALCSSQAPCTESIVESLPENLGDGSFQLMDSSAECVDGTDIQALDMDYISTEQSEVEKPDLHLESTKLSDQLTELLSEFPLGIKNYMPDLVPEPLFSQVMENLPLVEKVCTLTEQPELEQIFKENSPSNELPECEEELPVIENTCTLAEELPPLEPVSMVEGPHEQVSLSVMPKIESVESQALPELGESSSLRASPIDVMQTQLLNQEEAVSLYTAVEDTEKLDNLSAETKAATTGENDSPSKEKGIESDQEKKSSKEMPEFCCLFKWLTYSYGKAPKCSCKSPEDKSDERIFANPTAGMPVLSPELNLDSTVPKSPEHNFIEDLSPNELKASGSSDVESCIKQKEIKRKTSEECKPPVLDSMKEESLKRPHSSERRDAKPVLGANPYSQREKPELNPSKEQNPKKPKHDHSTSKKADKLIVKTDFLKHSKKERPSREQKSAQMPIGAGEQSASTSSSQRPAIDPVRRPESSKNSEKRRVPTQQRLSAAQSFQNGSWKPAVEKPKPTSSGLDRNVPFKPEDKTYEGQKPRAMPEHLQRRSSDNRDKSQESSMAQSKSQEKDSKRYSNSGKQKVRQNWNGHHVSHTKIKSPVKAKNVPLNRSSEQSTLAKNYNQFKREISKHKTNASSGNKHVAPNQSTQGRTTSSSKMSDVTKPSKSKDKIYLGPCNVFNRPSPNSISLTKLEIRSSPEKAKFTHAERRKSLEQTKPNKLLRTLEKNAGSPKMLQFKLCPELLQKSPSVHVRPEEPKTEKEHCRIEGIKSKKEAWYKDLPPKKRRIDSCDEQRDPLYLASAEATSSSPLSETESTRQYQESKAATFQAFQKMFLEQRSRSLDS